VRPWSELMRNDVRHEIEQERRSWRHASLLAAGCDHRVALALALRPDIDLRSAVRVASARPPAGRAAAARGPTAKTVA